MEKVVEERMTKSHQTKEDVFEILLGGVKDDTAYKEREKLLSDDEIIANIAGRKAVGATVEK